MNTLTQLQLITLSALIGAEAIVSYVYSLDTYDARDTRTSLFIGVLSAVVVFSTTGFYLGVLFYLSRFSLFDIEPGILSWIALFLICDLSYYLLHLLSHKVRFLWASHMLHHSSHKLNYTTVFRGPVVYLSFRMIFWTPMALIGFPPTMIIVTDTLIQLYTVFTHTTVIGRLGILEYVLNTPAHHRLHHASNPEYIDKNYGGVLIVWDRMFGTIVHEQAPPVFGLAETRDVHNPLRLFLMEWKAIARDFRTVRTWRKWVTVLFGKPGAKISKH
jgi:sterol desaturase/sphingolipid hydroxylase (fatty acid hydroxylase superfamily)